MNSVKEKAGIINPPMIPNSILSGKISYDETTRVGPLTGILAYMYMYMASQRYTPKRMTHCILGTCTVGAVPTELPEQLS